MTMAPDKLADLRVKHLEMVQSVISRLAGQCANMKNYCLTLTTAVCGFAITLQKPIVVAVAMLPIIVCALLDAQYLTLERRYRQVFDCVRLENWEARPTFEISSLSTPGVRYWGAFFSWSIISFYLSLTAAVVAVMLIARHIYGKFI